jgi:hypothetical protein
MNLKASVPSLVSTGSSVLEQSPSFHPPSMAARPCSARLALGTSDRCPTFAFVMFWTSISDVLGHVQDRDDHEQPFRGEGCSSVQELASSATR